MRPPRAPRLDERRAPEFSAELQERARAWIPEWGLADGERDFGRALLEIAARFNSEVAERLDGAGEKMRRGFLDWLAVRGEAARPARMPVVFKLAATAREAVLASAPVRMQADAAGTPVVFETEEDVRVVPGRLDVLIGVDADQDAFYLPPPGLSDLKPLEPLPTQWQLKSFAAAGAITLQLDPETGLVPGMIVEAAGQQYRIVQADKDLVTIDPPLVSELAAATSISKLTTFSPFDGRTRNQQAHALYLGDSELLNIEAAATIDVVGATSLVTGVTWQYWGKVEGKDEVGWQPLTLDDEKQKTINDAIVLTKPKGAIEQYEIGGKKSRWIRAFTKTISSDADPIQVEDFSIRINSSACGDHLTVCPPATPTESPEADAMANTTPLVLDNVFLPFGREPRQFDAFYLGSAEAFSKKGAQVRICFELGDPTFESLAAVRGTGQFANSVLAGIGKDHALHLFQFVLPDATISSFRDRDPLRPPIPGDSGAVPASTKPIGLNPKCRPVIKSVNNDFFVDVAAGGTIWTWHENAADGNLSGWAAFDPLPEPPNDPARIDDIVPVIQGILSPKVVLSSCRLFVHDGTEWSEKPTEDFTGSPPAPPPTNPPAVTLVALAPIWEDIGVGLDGLKADADMIGVSNDNLLYRVTTNGKCTSLPLVFGPSDEELVDAGTAPQNSTCNIGAMRPATLKVGTTLTVVTANKARNKLVMYQGDPDSGTAPLVNRIELPANDLIVGATVDLSFVNGTPQFSVLCKRPDNATYVASWQPIDSTHPDLKKILFKSPVSSSGSLGGAPVTLPAHIVAPGARGDLFVAAFDRLHRHVLTADAAEDGAVLPETSPLFAVNDAFSVIDSNGDRILRVVAKAGLRTPPDAPEILYPVTQPFGPVADNPELLAYRRSTPQFSGSILADDQMELDTNDSETVKGAFLVIEVATNVGIYEVVDIDFSISPPVAELSPDLPQASGSADYWTPKALTARVAPIIQLDPATNGNWDALLLDHAPLYFPTAKPDVQRAKAFDVTATNRPKVLALQSPWEQAPATGDMYIIDATLGDWKHLLADTSSNPELSWEYSNGTAWGSLILEEEGTLNFKNTGAVRFRVPNDLAAIDWAGKTNHWIRARLIGGDYGRGKVTVRTKTIGTGETEQTVEPSSKDIHAPSVVKLHISYGFCNEIQPAFVLAEDSGTIRDQSDANRTAGAIVETFVPLAVTLGRLSKTAVSPDAPDECPPECNCQTQHAGTGTTPATTPQSAPASSALATGRALFIGLAATPSEAPVNVLLLVAEHNHTAFSPMTTEALVADRFVPIVADDATRALGESGLLEMSFAIPPTPSNLFGRTGLTWLRLIPKSSTTGEWIPTLRGAYLNAVWASATETLTRELLGSSDGAPNLIVRLARPPVLHKTLELRVKEPLGEEERQALSKDDADRLLSEVNGLPGDWVLWKEVIDPDDEPAAARVYALDESNGEIRFGDGLHGAIPPIGRDSIVAFRYRRTEPDPTGGDSVPGNTIKARTALNLVSPVETVESVIAADQAAGGAPPESDDRVLRFGFARLRHRNRAVTAHDIEDLALQSSPDIVQARAIERQGYIRLVVVMRGRNPKPNAAQVRELRSLLLAAAPASLSAPNALRIEGPVIRRLRIELELQVERLDQAGELGTFVKDRLNDFFDTATGGTDNDGWALGVNPSEDDIAFALIAAPHLEGIAKVTRLESADDGKVRPWPETLKQTEIVMLADDPIRIQFGTAEVMI